MILLYLFGVVVVDLPLLRVAVEVSDNPSRGTTLSGDIQRSSMLFGVYRCVQLNRWYVGVFYIGDREGGVVCFVDFV